MKSLRLKRLNIIGVTMIIVVLPFCFYYLFFVKSQTDYFSNRNFRVLDNIGNQIKTKVDSLGTSLINAAKKAKQAKQENEEGGKANGVANGRQANDPIVAVKDVLDLIGKAGVTIVYDPASLRAEQVAQRQANSASNQQGPTRSMAGASEETVTGPGKPNPVPPVKMSTSRNTSAEAPKRAAPSMPAKIVRGSSPTIAASVKTEQGSFWLNLEYRGAANAVLRDFPVRFEIGTLFGPFVERYVIDELNQTQDRLFDEVLVAEQETGRVIFENGQSSLSIRSLSALQNNKGEKLATKPGAQSSGVEDISLGNENYKLFAQPVTLPFGASGEENSQGVKWVVCGLVRDSHFRDKTFAVSYTILIIFVFIVSLAALSWPLLKLRLMGPKDRLRRGDLGLTLSCALLGTALFTFLLLDLRMYAGLEKNLDRQLKAFVGKVRSNFQEELGSALAQLARLNRRILALSHIDHSGALGDLEAARLKTSLTSKRGEVQPQFSSKVNVLAGAIEWEKAPYPYFNSATWADGTGFQRIKWSTRDRSTAFVDVSNRSYFTNVRDGKLWKLSYAGRDYEYCIELVNAKTTGENVAVISTRVPGTLWESSLDTRLLSLMGTVLPEGYGYAVIDDEGNVLFHSDEVNNLQQHFFEECDNDRMLRAAVGARTEEFVDANYLGKGNRLFVSPLPDTPWVLVVFRDKQLARTINLELLTLSLVFYLVFALLLLALVSVIYLPHRRQRLSWLWPDACRAQQYWLLIIVNGLLCIAFLLALFFGSRPVLLIFCFVSPLAAVGIGTYILRKRPTLDKEQEQAEGGWRSTLSYRTRYGIVLALCLVLLSVLPTVGFFHIARGFEFSLLVKQGQVSITKALERREQRVALQYAAVKIGGQDEQKHSFLKRRLDPGPDRSSWDVYDSFFFDTIRSAPDADASSFVEECPASIRFAADADASSLVEECPAFIDRVLMKLRPLYDQFCVQSQELPRGGSSDKLWTWARDHDGRVRFQKDKDGRDGEMSLVLISSDPARVIRNAPLVVLISIVAIVVLLIIVYLLVCFVARNFFFLDQDPPRQPGGKVIVPATGNLLLLKPPSINGGETELGQHIDLSKVEQWQGWSKGIDSQVPDPKSDKTPKPIVLDHFEQGFDDPASNWEKLQAIEKLLGAGRRVIVVSTVDPLRFSLAPEGQPSGATSSVVSPPESKSPPSAEGGGKNGEGDKSVKERDQSAVSTKARWSLVFSEFTTVEVQELASEQFVTNNPEFLKVLNSSRPWRYLERIRHEMKGHYPSSVDDRAAADEEIREVLDRARPYHQAVWATCSQDERCALIHLALDGMISPKNMDLRQLMKRGLVVRDPALRLMDESFRRFVVSAANGEDLDAWRQAGGGSSWEMMKAPILLVLLSVAVFLFVTQKELYDSSISFVSALTAGIAALFRLFGMFQKGKAGGAA